MSNCCCILRRGDGPSHASERVPGRHFVMMIAEDAALFLFRTFLAVPHFSGSKPFLGYCTVITYTALVPSHGLAAPVRLWWSKMDVPHVGLVSPARK